MDKFNKTERTILNGLKELLNCIKKENTKKQSKNSKRIGKYQKNS